MDVAARPPLRYTKLPRFTADGRFPSPEILEEVVARVREIIEPEKIILFGSAARGTMKDDSDLDLMVVADLKEEQSRFEIGGKIYTNLHSRSKDYLDFGYDVIVATPKIMDELGPCPATVYGAALEEGKVLYES